MRQSFGRPAGLLALVVLAGLVPARRAAASGPAPHPAPSRVARPRLEPPSAPVPRQIHPLPPATAQLLWANHELQVTRPIRLMVFAPHPDDETLAAGRKRRRSGDSRLSRPKVLTFLIHYPNYPASPAWIKEIASVGVGGSSTAGRALSGSRWTHLQLGPAEIAAKGHAMSAYQSQIHVMNPFLKQFMLPFELFGELGAAQINAVPRQYAARFGRR